MRLAMSSRDRSAPVEWWDMRPRPHKTTTSQPPPSICNGEPVPTTTRSQASRDSDSHTSNVHTANRYSRCRPAGHWRCRTTRLVLRLEEHEAEALTVDRIQPVTTDETLGGLHSGQDLVRERRGRGRCSRWVNGQVHNCRVHSSSPFPRAIASCDALGPSIGSVPENSEHRPTFRRRTEVRLTKVVLHFKRWPRSATRRTDAGRAAPRAHCGSGS
jgi:hypothetical protein